MDGHRLALLIALYITLDFANPWMPGALNFNPDESIDGITVQHHHPRPRLAALATPVPLRLEFTDVIRGSTTPPVARVLGEWFVDLRQAHSAAFDSPPSLEDH